MLPLYLLNAIKGVSITVEQKNGTTIEGVLENVDNWMNLTLLNASITSSKETRKASNIYIRGVQIKQVKMPNDVVDHYKEQQLREKENQNRGNRNRRFNNNNNSGNNYNNNNNNYNNNNNNNNNNSGNNNYQRRGTGNNNRYNNNKNNSNYNSKNNVNRSQNQSPAPAQA